jgi:hypothetical protein
MSLWSWAGNSAEYIAWHESGHAAAYWALEIPLAYVTTVGRGQQDRPHVQPIDVKQGTHGQKALVGASGLIAGFIHNGQHLTDRGIVELLVGSADGRFELQGVTYRAVNRLPRDPLFGAGEDLERVRPDKEAGNPFTADRAIAFWRDCERFVVSVVPIIKAIAFQLVRLGTLEGKEAARLAAAAMPGRTRVQIPWWTAEE